MLCCPSCGSTAVYRIAGGYVGELYRCKDCGYIGALILECDDEEDEKGKKTGKHDKHG